MVTSGVHCNTCGLWNRNSTSHHIQSQVGTRTGMAAELIADHVAILLFLTIMVEVEIGELLKDGGTGLYPDVLQMTHVDNGTRVLHYFRAC